MMKQLQSLKNKLTGIAWFFRHWPNHKLCLHLSKKTVKNLMKSYKWINFYDITCVICGLTIWWKRSSMLFWKAVLWKYHKKGGSDVPKSEQQYWLSKSGYKYGQEITEIDPGKYKLIHPRENWCLLTARSCQTVHLKDMWVTGDT